MIEISALCAAFLVAAAIVRACAAMQPGFTLHGMAWALFAIGTVVWYVETYHDALQAL